MPEEKRDFFEAVPNPEEALKNLYQNILKSRLENSRSKIQEFTQLLETEKTDLSPKDFKHICTQLKNLDQLRGKIKSIMRAAEVLLWTPWERAPAMTRENDVMPTPYHLQNSTWWGINLEQGMPRVAKDMGCL